MGGGGGGAQGLAATQISFRKEVLLKSLNDIFTALTALIRRVISVSRMFLCSLVSDLSKQLGEKYMKEIKFFEDRNFI